jgi:GWxTD domain-containing protein
MTPLESWVHTPLAQAVSLALAHFLWEGVLIAVILAAALCVARSSRARYGAACVAMLLMMASFGVTLVRLMPKPMAKAPHASIRIPTAPAGLPLVPLETLPTPPSLAALLPWIAPFWAAGVLFFHLRSLGGWMAARRLRHAGVCRAPADWQQRLDGLAARLRISKPAALLESCLADVPVVIGYLRPVILMPVGLLAGLPVAQVEAILIHELAHIRRQDYLVNLMQTFVEGLLFYHPAVWWISGVIRAERENCCDDLAVAAIGDARQYAAALTALEQNRWAAHELVLAATGGSLVKRIRRVLQQPERPRAAWTLAIPAGLLVISAGIALASWQTPPAQKPQAPVPAVLSTPVAPVAVELPAVDTDHRAPIWNRVPGAAKPAPVLLAQVQQTPQSPPATQSVERQLQWVLQLEDQTSKEPPNPYRKWLNEDVAYIISDEERRTFNALPTDAEREQFVTQFWLRRDPTPGTPENEFKAEHYRRIAYANEHYATSGLPGWKTDRGRIYITYGPPDEIEDHSSGGFYVRPPEEGGGTTSTFRFQQWRYRHADGIGNNIIIEFVDPTMSGEFRMTKDPSEKDALLYVPGAGLTMMEQMGLADKTQRFKNTDGTHLGQAFGGQPANIFVSAGDGPKVTLSITAERRTVGAPGFVSSVATGYIGIALPSSAEKYDIIGRIVDANNRTVINFRDVAPGGQFNEGPFHIAAAGSYTMTVVVRDRASGAMQTSTVNFYVN